MEVKTLFPSILFFFHLNPEQIANKYTKAEEPIVEPKKPDGLKLIPVVYQTIPTFYANNTYFFYDSSGDDFKIIFGEIGKGEFKIDMEDPSGEKSLIEGNQGFQVSLRVIFPSKVLLSLISTLKRNIKQYEDKYGSLPLKPTKKPKGIQL